MTLTFCWAIYLRCICWHLLGFCLHLLASKLISFVARTLFFFLQKVCVFRMFFVANIHLNVDVVVFFCLIVDVDVDFNQFCFWMMI